MKYPITGAILAGGQSKRMGQDKGLLKLNGVSLVENIYHKMAGLFQEMLIVDNSPGKFPFPGILEIKDTFPNTGPLGGIHAALKAAHNDIIFVVACDMPLFKPEDAQPVLTLAHQYECVVPVLNERIQTLFSSYHKSCLPKIEALLAAKNYKLLNLFNLVDAHFLQEEAFASESIERICCNLNTPEDYQKIKNILMEQ